MKLTPERIHAFCLEQGEIVVITPSNLIKTITGKGKKRNYFAIKNAEAFHHGKKWYTKDEFEKFVDKRARFRWFCPQ
jgi:hypothetical protein